VRFFQVQTFAAPPWLGTVQETPLPLSAPRASYSLTAIVENDNPRADECCTPAENPARLNGFDDGEEAKAVVNRVGNPAVSPGQVADMNVSMPIRHGMFVARFSALAKEHERLTRFKVLICIATTLDPGGRFAFQLCYPTRVRPYTLLLEQGQGAGPPTLLADLLRLAMRSNKNRVDRRQRDCGPG
jgi:hypothetical protein